MKLPRPLGLFQDGKAIGEAGKGGVHFGRVPALGAEIWRVELGDVMGVAAFINGGNRGDILGRGYMVAIAIAGIVGHELGLVKIGINGGHGHEDHLFIRHNHLPHARAHREVAKVVAGIPIALFLGIGRGEAHGLLRHHLKRHTAEQAGGKQQRCAGFEGG